MSLGERQASAIYEDSSRVTINRSNGYAMRRFQLQSKEFSASTGVSRLPKGRPAWVTAELLEQTIAAWQQFYDHSLTLDDALEIILNVAALSDALIQEHDS